MQTKKVRACDIHVSGTAFAYDTDPLLVRAPYCSWSRLARSPLTKFIFVKAEARGTLPKATRFVGEAAHRRASTKPSSTRSLAVKVFHFRLTHRPILTARSQGSPRA